MQQRLTDGDMSDFVFMPLFCRPKVANLEQIYFLMKIIFFAMTGCFWETRSDTFVQRKMGMGGKQNTFS